MTTKTSRPGVGTGAADDHTGSGITASVPALPGTAAIVAGSTFDLAERYRIPERAFACAVLHVGTPEVLAAVQPAQVADPLARQVLEVSRRIAARGQHPDAVTVGAEPGALIPRWPVEVVNLYTEPAFIPANWPTYAALVTEGWQRREAVAAAERVVQAAETQDLGVVVDALAAAGAVADTICKAGA